MSEESEKRMSLSLSKLTSLLSKYSYTLVSTYCTGDDVHFIEARTPKLQKTFVVHIPSKYKMKCDDESYKRFQITPVSSPSLVSSRQLDYLMEIKGPLIDCDLLSISSSALCLYKNNGNVDYYKIGDYFKANEDEFLTDSQDQNLDNIEQIVKDATAIMRKIDPETEPPEEPEETFLTPDDLEQMTLVESKKDTNVEEDVQFELEFEDGSGEPVDESVHLMTDDAEKPGSSEDSGGFSDDRPRESSNASQESKKPQRRDNPLPPTLEDADISLGIVYYSIDITLFYKRVVTLEDDILSIYNTLDDNEDDLRVTKITEITLLTEKIVQKSKTEVDNIKKKELELKSQLITLSSILEKTESFQTRMEKDKKKFADIKPEIDRVQTQTKTTIYDINVELLRVRDATDDLLDSIQTSLEEILNI